MKTRLYSMLALLLIAVTSTWAGNIQIAATQNGTVTTTVDDVIVTEAAAGTTVTINVIPADGYVLKDGQLTIQEYVDAGSAHAPRKAPSLSAPQTLTVNAEGKVTFLMPENNVYISGATFISTEFDNWVVAGSADALNCKSWDRSAAENMMSTTDGKNYTLVVTDAVLKKGTTYECKAVKQPMVANPTDDDYIWRPYNNVQFTTGENETGKYTVTYTFVAPENIETEEGQLTVALERTGDAETPTPELEKLYIIGDMNQWSRTNPTELTFDETAQAFKYEVTTTGNYHFAFTTAPQTEDEATADQNWSVFNSTLRYGYAGTITETGDTQYELTHGDNTTTLTAGTYTILVTKDLKMTVKGEIAPPPAEDTYVVAGNGPATNGVEWDATAEVNKMTTEDNDTYTLVVENAELAADGIYTWKVVKNGSIWIPDGMGNDLTVDIAEDGIYTVTYKYVVSTGEEIAVAEKTGELVVLPEVIDYPTSVEGITIGGTTTYDNVKIHTNNDALAGIKFANGYTTGGVLNDNYVTIAVKDGFKAGDVITIAGAFNNSDETKLSAVDIFALDAEGKPVVLFTTQQFVNGRTSADDPAVETYTLTADYDELYLGRNGNTGTFITLLKTEKGVTPPPAEDTYVVAGNGPATNGVEWDATAEVNKMTTEDNDTYTLVVENAELAADGIYTWKVVKNGSIWIPDGIGNDLKLDIAEDGIYTVTYKYVVSTGEETAEAVKTGDIPVVVTTWTVAGASVRDAAAGANDILFGLTWDATATDNDMVKGNDGLWTLKKASVALTTNNVITFKVYKNHAFDESYPEENKTCEVTANSVYDVTFTFNEETKVVTVQLTDVAPVTGISAIQTEALNGNVYNTNGQRVGKDYKGIVIVNGKKVLVK